MSIRLDLETCYECWTVYEEHLRSECPTCKLRKEMQEKIDELNELIRSFHPLE